MKKSFGEVFEDRTKYGIKIKTDEYRKSGKHLIIDQGQEQIAGYTDLEEGLFDEVPSVIFGDHTRIIKYVDKPFFLGADGVKVLRSRLPDANYKYLYYALRNVKIPNTGYNRHFKWLKEVEIQYPNASRQAEIVYILDKVEGIIDARQKELQQLANLIKARFVEMFGDMESNPKGWRQSTLGDECYYIKDGPHKSPKYLDGTDGIPFISTRNVVNGDGIDWSTAKYISEADYLECIKKCHPEKGDILYSKGGTTGIAKLVDTDIRFANWVHVAVLKFGEQLDGRFLECMLNMDYCYAQSQALTKGIANRDFVLSAIAQVKIYVPPVDLQEQYTEFVKQIDKSKAVVQKALDETQLLFDSLMQKYFG